MIQPLLLDAPKAPRQGLPTRARAFFTQRWPGRVVAAAFGIRVLDGLLSFAGWGLPDVLTVPAGIVLWLFLAWLVLRALRWLADRLLWRIRTKLIVSYLFIALVPVVLLTLFMAVAGVLLLGLMASRVVTAEVERASDVLLTTARAALSDLPESDDAAARALPARLAPARELHPGLGFTLAARRARGRDVGRGAPLAACLARGQAVQGLGAARPRRRGARRGAARGVAGAGRGAPRRAARRLRVPGRDRAAHDDPRVRARAR